MNKHSNHNYKEPTQNHRENPQQDHEFRCEQCEQVPDNYVQLDCTHKFCLICLAYAYLQQQESNGEDNYLHCLLCSQLTILDPETVSALQIVIQECLFPLMQQQQDEMNDRELGDQEEQEEIEEQQIEETQEPLNEQDVSRTEILEEINNEYKTQQTSQGFKYQQRGLDTEPNSGANDSIYNRSKPSILQKKSFHQIFKSKEKAEPYLDRLNQCIEIKLQNLRELQIQKEDLQARCEESKTYVQKEFQKIKIMCNLEQQRSNFFNEVNNIEMVNLMRFSKFEQEQENDMEQIHNQSENLKVIIQRGSFNSSSHQAITFQNVLMDIENLVSNFNYLDNTSVLESNQMLSKLDLQIKQFFLRFRFLEPSNGLNIDRSVDRHPKVDKSNERESRNIQIESILKSIQIKEKNQQRSKYDNSPQSNLLQEIFVNKNLQSNQIDHESQHYPKSNQKINWKEELLDIFDRKSQVPEKEQSHISGQKKAPQQKLNIHQALSLQQRHFQDQKQSLLRK